MRMRRHPSTMALRLVADPDLGSRRDATYQAEYAAYERFMLECDGFKPPRRQSLRETQAEAAEAAMPAKLKSHT